MNVAVTGSHGLIGTRLVQRLSNTGHHVIRVVRGAASGRDEIAWNPDQRQVDVSALAGIDAVVHLAGESIAAGRWTTKQKQKILDSRVQGTSAISKALASLDHPPRVFLCASAIGYYGDRGDELLTEQSRAGAGFLPEVCQAWEAACQPARERGIRTVNLRFGVVLSRDGGALQKMLLPFKLGLGGRVCSGRQWMSWVSIDDAVAVIEQAVLSKQLAGPVNVVSPNATTNAEFTKGLGKALSRPTIFPLPAPIARLAFGEMADGLLLSSTRVQPAKLLSTGFQYHHVDLDAALRHVLAR